MRGSVLIRNLNVLVLILVRIECVSHSYYIRFNLLICVIPGSQEEKKAYNWAIVDKFLYWGAAVV